MRGGYYPPQPGADAQDQGRREYQPVSVSLVRGPALVVDWDRTKVARKLFWRLVRAITGLFFTTWKQHPGPQGVIYIQTPLLI